MRVSKKTIQKWCDALRRGEYRQTNYALQNDNGYCCLGVACELFIKPELQMRFKPTNYLVGCYPNRDNQPKAPRWLLDIGRDFESKTGINPAHLNDNGISLNLADTLKIESIEEPLTFDEIADLLEAVYIHEVLA